MGNYMERKIVFLYPELSSLKRDEYEKTCKLLADIERISFAANRKIENILCSHCFQTIKCKPNISMEVVNDSVTDFQIESNVRICVAKYGTTDYTQYYSKIVEEFKRETSDISHLVALDISPSETKTNFFADSKGDFDAIITVDLEHLDILLESIMLDISLYHYFSLSKDPIRRKQFNSCKFSYIVNNYSPEMLSYYGKNIDKDSQIYLPISLCKLNEYVRRTKLESKNDTIKSLIADYAVFLIEANSEKYHYNEHGKFPYDEENTEHGSIISDFVQHNSLASQWMSQDLPFVVIFYLQESTEKLEPLVIKYDNENRNYSDWTSRIGETDCEYIIFQLTRGALI